MEKRIKEIKGIEELLVEFEENKIQIEKLKYMEIINGKILICLIITLDINFGYKKLMIKKQNYSGQVDFSNQEKIGEKSKNHFENFVKVDPTI